MQSRGHASPDDIDMASVFGALKRSARWLIPLSLVFGGLTYAALSLVAPRYQSEAELAIVAKGAGGTFADRNAATGPDLITTRMDKEAINTHVRAMQSQELLEKIAKDLKLAERPEFNGALGPVDKLDAALRLVGIGGPRKGETTRDRVLDALRSRLEVYAAKESRFIGVRVTSNDPELAAKIANALAENYRASLAEQGVTEVDDLQAVLQAKVQKLTTEVAAAETEVDRYRGKIDGFRGGAQNTGLNEQQMSELTAELTKAKAARGEAEVRAKSAREMIALGSADQLADVQKSPLIQNLVQQRVRIERQISELSATLLPGHPRMRQLNADLAGLKVQIDKEISKIVDSLEKEAAVAKGREDSIAQSLADIKARVVTNAPEEAQLRQLEATAKAKRTELDNIQAQLESNRKKLDARAQPVAAQIISNAQPESVPVFPRKGALSALIAIASLMFGTAWVVTKALFQGARRGSQGTMSRQKTKPVSLRQKPAFPHYPEPLLREIIDDETPSPLSSPVSLHEPQRQTAAASAADIGALVLRLMQRRPQSGGHRTILTGENENVDASKEALDLVKALAQSGEQVILVDWNPDGQDLASSIGLNPSAGLNDLLRGNVNFGEIIQRIPGSDAHAIASGNPLEHVPECIDPDQLNLVLDALDEAYEYIVVTGRHDAARQLFETIEGRFDTGIVVTEPRKQAPVIEDPVDTFLGFEVADIDIVRFERRVSEASPVQQRIARATERRSVEVAHPT
ncbi:lipopolysaccharide biosynthesis protein [Hyphomicrobium denitrificans 1NES1]|uniref:Lipopolysaccharide biosynthesis protein n=1 Tax=Hyphomicrobium denitrificans 1NES1 TaxID=670307 RepID=N0BD33_9HYPH|nr:exopolysaccharide transport family protein [Hyphomicrobium denitrificans]AGK58030.1 lipopolysaccharide biosynthesis protein [Hyphomicrobium denitrificans 1NES1]